MKQITQELKSGKMEIEEVPFPVMTKGQILVRNYFSVISAGTEGKTVSDARKGYIAKAKSRQKEVKMVINSIKTEGLKKTYGVVMNKLEALSPLGYSCAGEVIAVAEDVNDIKIGDFVACGGSGAYHADVVAVFRNLCVKIPKNVDLSHAAFTTIASIAIQGIRQADLRFGENCTVIGLGLIGLLTVQILKAAGIKAIGVDIDPKQVEIAKKIGADLSLNRNQEGISQIVKDFTNGNGTDAIIIAAGTSSNDPVEFAGEIARKKGKVVIVGAVPTGFSRPNYYRKELDLRMSSSYGPGRYDSDYEEKGKDYPIGYVRFTENRNMQSFIDLLSDRKLDIESLITHKFELANSPKAYDLILEKKEQVIGVLLKYDTEIDLKKDCVLSTNKNTIENSLNVSFIGAGNFAQNAILPRIKKDCLFKGILTQEGNASKYVAKKYGFEYCASSTDKILNDNSTGTVFVVTRHDTHAEFCKAALEKGKNVYVEKPLALNLSDLKDIREAYKKSGKGLMLGFNRRFSPLMEKIMKQIDGKSKKAINIRVNAGVVPSDHWVHDVEVGGGRILGEVCHFIDLAYYIAGAKISSVNATVLNTNPQLNDTVSVNLTFTNGSIANISYFSNGNKNVPKERIEIFSNGTVFLIDDFKSLEIHKEESSKKIKLKSQDKGHSKQFELVLDSLKKGKEFPISFNEIYHSSFVTLETIRSIKEKRIIKIT